MLPAVSCLFGSPVGDFLCDSESWLARAGRRILAVAVAGVEGVLGGVVVELFEYCDTKESGIVRVVWPRSDNLQAGKGRAR